MSHVLAHARLIALAILSLVTAIAAELGRSVSATEVVPVYETGG